MLVHVKPSRSVVPTENEYRDDDAPGYSLGQFKDFEQRAVIPVDELRYWLWWANKLRQAPREEHLDYPSAEQVLRYLQSVTEKFSPKLDWVFAAAEASVVGREVPRQDFENFLGQFSEAIPSRVVLIQALDKFVGRYI